MAMDSDGTNSDGDDDVDKNDYGYSTHALNTHTIALILNDINMHKYSSGV